MSGYMFRFCYLVSEFGSIIKLAVNHIYKRDKTNCFSYIRNNIDLSENTKFAITITNLSEKETVSKTKVIQSRNRPIL